MGRKPHGLIAEFFERGQKINDLSNRYEQTCKSCGERFPKGRPERLANHLMRSCPAISTADRERVLRHFNDPPVGTAQIHAVMMHGSWQHGADHSNLSYAPPNQGLSALETLAEVSRQQLDLSGKSSRKRARGAKSLNPQGLPPRRIGLRPLAAKPPSPPVNHAPIDGSFMDEFLVHDERHDGHGLAIGAAVSQALETPGAPALSPLHQLQGSLPHSPRDSAYLATTTAPMNPMDPSLVMTASAATELSNLLPLSNAVVDPDLSSAHTEPSTSADLRIHHPWSGPTQSFESLISDQQRNLRTEECVLNALPRAPSVDITDPSLTSNVAANHQPSDRKVRGRFSETRRLEVRDMRRHGACIRCRMLKKPCSPGDPCRSCTFSEAARLWKQPCFRTRIAEEFTLYSVGLQATLTFQALGYARNQLRLDPVPGRLEATHHVDSNIFATFPTLRSSDQAMANADIDPVILGTFAPLGVEIIDDEDTIPTRLEHYVQKSVHAFVDAESSPFMAKTIQTGFALGGTNPDGLFLKVVELWHLTQILTSRDLRWHLYSNPVAAPTMTPTIITQSELEEEARVPITPREHSTSYRLITLQLQAAAEKRAGPQARMVMNDLERRLLRRQQIHPFETFLIAVILLACVERMCWLFQRWDQKTTANAIPAPDAPSIAQAIPDARTHDAVSSPQPESDAALAQALQSASATASGILGPEFVAPSLTIAPKWPFDRSPSYYVQQGERFSDILHMLVNIRGVRPKPMVRLSDDRVVVWGEDGVDEEVRAWYESVGLTGRFLAERMGAVEAGDDPREWEGRFIGKIVGSLGGSG
ncbi:hypothetical protein M011DRAFT_487181 [Sporormia fimetaria CBS 119925]|uniref:Zn(2)-C6 fungal-type domain-containing protein n=1 Tax=Sporormia fimetaria CBS 119925 TaxID=1340428 RepID=A0A6A6V7B0_9PLEO|nr:hypothetical protein M011DRAFT_487181 [Sporormia fimetaria CBS 119925]